MRRFYKPSLWIPQHFLLTNPNLHHGLLSTIWNWRWESTSSHCSENAWRATADVLPETFHHRFPCEDLRRLPNHIKDAGPDIPILKEAKAEYTKLQ